MQGMEDEEQVVGAHARVLGEKHQESQYATCQSCRTEPEDIHAPQRFFPTEAIHGKEQGHRDTKPGTKVWREPFSAGLFFLHGFYQAAFA